MIPVSATAAADPADPLVTWGRAPALWGLCPPPLLSWRCTLHLHSCHRHKRPGIVRVLPIFLSVQNQALVGHTCNVVARLMHACGEAWPLQMMVSLTIALMDRVAHKA
jgi:hypothetical protein